MGVSPGWGGGVRLVQLLGRTVALRLLATGEVLNSDAAHDVGLADFIVDDLSGLDETKSILTQLTAAASPHVLQAAKKVVVNAMNDSSVRTVLEAECSIFQTTWAGDAHIRALGSNVKFK